MNIKVKNRNHTADNDAKCCGTWIAHWKKHRGFSPSYCRGCNYTGKDLVGGHVNKVGNNTDDKWYIVPLCKGCNNIKDKEFCVEESDLVWVGACDK